MGYPISCPISDELPHGQELSEQLSCQLSYGQAAFDQLSLAKQLCNEQPRFCSLQFGNVPRPGRKLGWGVRLRALHRE